MLNFFQDVKKRKKKQDKNADKDEICEEVDKDAK